MSAVYASVAVSLPDVDEEIHITVTIVASGEQVYGPSFAALRRLAAARGAGRACPGSCQAIAARQAGEESLHISVALGGRQHGLLDAQPWDPVVARRHDVHAALVHCTPSGAASTAGAAPTAVALLTAAALALRLCLQISAVFVLYTVADAIVYENTLELATSILLGGLRSSSSRGGIGSGEACRRSSAGRLLRRRGPARRRAHSPSIVLFCCTHADALALACGLRSSPPPPPHPPAFMPTLHAFFLLQRPPQHPLGSSSASLLLLLPCADTLVLARVMWFAISGTRNQSFTIALCTAMAVCQAVYVVSAYGGVGGLA